MIARHRIATLLCVAFLLVLPLTLFLSVTFGHATLLPADNLFAWQPFRSLAASFGVSQPQNGLLSDLILENYPWKRFIIDSIRQGELPLWNPYLFGGIPFLAAGQHSALYPFSILYYLLPLDKAYGWFTVLNLGLAGIFFFIFMRTLGLSRASSTLAGVAYQLSGFMIVSVVFPMIIAAAAWLPLILTMVELVIRQQKALRGQPERAHEPPAESPARPAGQRTLGIHRGAGHHDAYPGRPHRNHRLYGDHRGALLHLAPGKPVASEPAFAALPYPASRLAGGHGYSGRRHGRGAASAALRGGAIQLPHRPFVA
ncbi:MAG: YfhO family protein [Chloroflexi bacterium]|nr:YfhO family protein [Chloroflexota bacterium]